MEVTFLKSSSCIIKHGKTCVLTDPWLDDGEYYGSWYHYPKFDYSLIKEKITYIYISHIHPDHLSQKTMQKLNKKSKVLIHKYSKPFLKKIIENIGFEVIEINHGEKFELSEDFYIDIFAADDCNPNICKKFFGCEVTKKELGSDQIDTIAVFSNKNLRIINVNDCPYEMSQNIIKKIKKKYKKFDLLLTGYSGAGPYPQCFGNLKNDTKIIKANEKKKFFLSQANNFIKDLKPSYCMPFAGTYFLSGKFTKLNIFRGVPTRFGAKEFLEKNRTSKNTKIFTLETGGKINLNNNQIIEEQKNDNDILTKDKINFLQRIKMDYENKKKPPKKNIIKLLDIASKRFIDKLLITNFKKNYNVCIYIGGNCYYIINTKSKSCKIIKDNSIKKPFLKMKLNLNLLENILKGPKFSHWNNAEIGSHIMYLRDPDVYDRNLFYCLNFLHT